MCICLCQVEVGSGAAVERNLGLAERNGIRRCISYSLVLVACCRPGRRCWPAGGVVRRCLDQLVVRERDVEVDGTGGGRDREPGTGRGASTGWLLLLAARGWHDKDGNGTEGLEKRQDRS